ncbi:MAG: histidine kinase, partial [Saprospiraceae bacterium]|nr:histidine kinase [Saprospiraceae bacterium]
YIYLKLSVDQGRVYFKIKNSINKNNSSPGVVSTETGIENVKRRMAILYPGIHNIEISKTDQDFQVNLEIEI